MHITAVVDRSIRNVNEIRRKFAGAVNCWGSESTRADWRNRRCGVELMTIS